MRERRRGGCRRLCRVLTPAVLAALATLSGGIVRAGGAPDGAPHRLESRLRTTGVDRGLAKKISNAVDLGVAYLLRAQHKDGSWRLSAEGWRAGSEGTCGVTALCALAMRHAEVSVAEPSLRRALNLVLDHDTSDGKGMGRTYVDGLLGLLLSSRPGNAAALVGVVARLTASQDLDTSWWGYWGRSQNPTLSTSYFAVLGLWSAGLAGRSASQAVWIKHIASLLRYQTSSGSWPYIPKGIPSGSDRGTFMGYSNLLLAKSSLAGKLEPPSALRRRVLRAVRRGQKALVRDGVRLLKGIAAASRKRESWQHPYPFYCLYALEQACVFSGTALLGRHPWYAEGAKFLVRVQRSDGAWGTIPPHGPGAKVARVSGEASGDCISTALALLFLLRSSEVYRPTTPRQLDPVPAVVTGREK